MSYQPIGLGTPNNNDGDSLYAGGVKINANFAELYVALAGSSSAALKIAIGTTPGTSTTLSWNNSLQQFVPSSSDAIRTLGAVTSSSLYLTNNSGVAGSPNNDLTGSPNTQYLFINGRQIYNARAYVTSTAANTRAEIHFGMGLGTVTSVSFYTTGAVVRGARGLTVYVNTAEDNAASSLVATSTTSGIQLYQTPTLDLASMSTGVRTGSDSSMALCHTGFVALNLTKYTLSSTQITAQRGLVSVGSSLTSSLNVMIDGIYHPKHCEGLIYNYNTLNNVLTLVTGAACHWSYNTSGVAGLVSTSSIAMVASYTPILRTFTAGWTPEYDATGSKPAVIDATVQTNTWYYLYYIGCLQQHTVGSMTFYPGSSNVVVSSNRDIASVDAQLRAAGYGPAGPNGYWQVVRRLGPVKTDNQTPSTRLVPFNVKRIDHGAFEYYWGLNSGTGGWGGTGQDTSYTTTATVPPIFLPSTSINTSNFTGALLPTIPPIPGITAFITVRHRPSSSVPYVYLYGEAWTVNSSISALYPPFETIRSLTSGQVNLHNIQLPMSPDGCYIPDGTYNGAGILSVMNNSGQTIRYAMIGGESTTGSTQTNYGSSLALQFTVTGFRYAR